MRPFLLKKGDIIFMSQTLVLSIKLATVNSVRQGVGKSEYVPFCQKNISYIYITLVFVLVVCSDLYFAFLFYSQPVIMTTFDVS